MNNLYSAQDNLKNITNTTNLTTFASKTLHFAGVGSKGGHAYLYSQTKKTCLDQRDRLNCLNNTTKWTTSINNQLDCWTRTFNYVSTTTTDYTTTVNTTDVTGATHTTDCTALLV